MRRILLAVLTGLVLPVLAVGSGSGTASASPMSTAAAATTTPNLCGSSYALIDTYYKRNDSSDRTDLQAALYFSAKTKRNCFIVSHYGAWRGHKGASLATIRPKGAAWPKCNSTGCDKGEYAYYAGPVYTPAGVDMSHRCVDFSGTTAYDTYITKYGVHCG